MVIERWKPSVTVAAVIEHDGRFLLVEEETAEGLRLNNPACAEDVTYLRLAFRGTVGAALGGRVLDRGIVRTWWLTPGEMRAEAARMRSPLVLQCLDDHLAGRRFPLDLVSTHASGRDPEVKR